MFALPFNERLSCRIRAALTSVAMVFAAAACETGTVGNSRPMGDPVASDPAPSDSAAGDPAAGDSVAGDPGGGDSAIVYPSPTDGELYVVAYDALAGEAHPSSPPQMFWQSSYATVDGTLIEWGTGDHGTTSDNGVREFDPLTGLQTYVYPNNSGTLDQTQYDNLHYWYIPRLDSLVIPSRGQYARASGAWPIGDLKPGTAVVGTGAANLFYPDSSVDLGDYLASYNMHQAWSAARDAGVAVGGGHGGDSVSRPHLWIVVPSAGLGSFPTPYVLYQRDLPSTLAGAVPYKSVGRDGACVLDDYVYWVGGGESLTHAPTPHFFRMSVLPHLTSTSAPLDIERLPDAPAAFNFGLLRADPYLDALLAVTDTGLFAFDVVNGRWEVVTPAAYLAEFQGAPMFGLLPAGNLGDFVDARAGTTLRRFYWRPGHNFGWEYDYGGAHTRTMHTGFRSITLGRR